MGSGLSRAPPRAGAQAIETGLALLLFTPGLTTELAMRMGVSEDFDVGVKWAGPSLGVDCKYQILHQEPHGMDLAATVGYGYHLGHGASAAGVIDPILDFIRLGDFSQHDFNGAPHPSLSNTMHTVMGPGGLMVGDKYVYLMAELTVAKVFFEPTVLGQRRDFGGYVVAPPLVSWPALIEAAHRAESTG